MIENPELVWVLEGSVGNIQSGRKYGPKTETDRKLLWIVVGKDACEKDCNVLY